MTYPVGSSRAPTGMSQFQQCNSTNLPKWLHEVGEAHKINLRSDNCHIGVDSSGKIVIRECKKRTTGMLGHTTTTIRLSEEGQGSISSASHLEALGSLGGQKALGLPRPSGESTRGIEVPESFSTKSFRMVRRNLPGFAAPKQQALAEYAEDRLDVDIPYGAKLSRDSFTEGGVAIADALLIQWQDALESCYIKASPDNGKAVKNCSIRLGEIIGKPPAFGRAGRFNKKATALEFDRRAVKTVYTRIPVKK